MIWLYALTAVVAVVATRWQKRQKRIRSYFRSEMFTERDDR